MIRLVSTFLNSEAKPHTFSFPNPDVTKSPEEIKEALTLLTTLDIFEKNGVGLFKEVVKAKYVETIVTPIFEGDEMFGNSSLEEPEVSEDTPAEQLMTLSCTWQETPKIPEIALDLPPYRSEVHEVLSASMNHHEVKEKLPEVTVSTLSTAQPITAEEKTNAVSGNFYDVVKGMVTRRKWWKAKEKERNKRKNPPEAPS